MESIKERDPLVLLSYFEFTLKLFGSPNPTIFYPLYFTAPENHNDEIDEEQNQEVSRYDTTINDNGEEGVPDMFDDPQADYYNEEVEEEEDLSQIRTRSKRAAAVRTHSYSEQSMGIKKGKKKGGKRKKWY
jgi:hypothetical protein